MDGERFDRMVKAFHGITIPRRAVFGALASVGGLVAAYRIMFAQPYCIPQGGNCTLFLRCCQGFICSVGYNNPNVGVCVAGTTTSGAWFAFPGMLTPMVTVTPRPTRKADRNKNQNERARRRNDPTKTPQPTNTPVPTDTPVPTATPTFTPTPAPPAFGVEVELVLDCDAVPELTTIDNVGVANFTIVSMNVPGSGRTPLELGVVLKSGAVPYEIRTFAPGTTGASNLEYYVEPTTDLYAEVKIEFAQGKATYRGYCNGSPTVIVPEV